MEPEDFQLESEPVDEWCAPPPPELRTTHFFLLTAATAVLVALHHAWVDWDEIPEHSVVVYKIQLVVFPIFYAVAWTASLVLLGRRWRYGLFDVLAPGHWILLSLAIATLIQGFTALCIVAYEHNNESPFLEYESWHLNFLISMPLGCAVYLLFAWLMTGSLWWKSNFILPAIVMLALLPQHLLMLSDIMWNAWLYEGHFYISIGLSTILLVVTAIACVSDTKNKVSRDWIHWLGVGVIVLNRLVSIAAWIYWHQNSY